MDFSEVEKLKQEDVMELYDNIMEFGDDERLAGCCCASGSGIRGVHSLDACRAWCRGLGSSCTGWHSVDNYRYSFISCGVFSC